MIQDYILKPVRAAAILTNGVVAGTVLEDCHLLNQLVILADFTLGSLTTADIIVEYSDDGTNFYQEVMSSLSAGVDTVTSLVHRLSASGKRAIAIPIKSRFVRISAIGNGTVTSSSLKIDAILGVA